MLRKVLKDRLLKDELLIDQTTPQSKLAATLCVLVILEINNKIRTFLRKVSQQGIWREITRAAHSPPVIKVIKGKWVHKSADPTPRVGSQVCY